MTRPLHKFFSLLLLGLLLAGCMQQQKQPPPISIDPAQPSAPSEPPQPEPQPGVPLPQPPKQAIIDWDASVQLLVQQMLQTQGVAVGSVLLVDRIKNRTNGSLQTSSATTALLNALANSDKFTLVNTQQLNSAKEAFGLSPDDSLNFRSKAMGLARYLGAQYVLYTSVQGEVKSLELYMQLMLVETGEIIWSGKDDIQY